MEKKEYIHEVIDCHYHIMNWFSPEGRNFWEDLDEYVNGRNFRSVNLNAIPSMEEQDVSSNIMAALYKLYHPEIYAHGGLVYDKYPVSEVMPEGMDPLTQYRELMEIGFDGIKMLETKPTEMKVLGRPVSDPLYADFFKAVADDGTHMLWHVADPETYWDPDVYAIYLDGTYPSKEEVYGHAMKILEKNPHLNVTFAHFFFMSEHPEELEEIFQTYPNVSVDLTPGGEMYESFGKRYEYYRDFFIRYADRILFGTDSTRWYHIKPDNVYQFLTTDDEMQMGQYEFKGIKLPAPAYEQILCNNFLRGVSEKPKPINKDALRRYIDKYQHLIQNQEVKRQIEEVMMRGM